MRAFASLNRVYRLVWNRSREMWIPLPEISRGRGKAGRSALIGALLLGSGLAQAGVLPTGGQIVSGAGSIRQNGTTLTVQQNSSKLITNWQSFSIGSGDTVLFRQPSTTSIALNRVLGNDPSQIFGHLTANGEIFLINPNGVLFAPGSSVNVGGLVASTLNLSNSDFLSGNYHFTATANPASNVNQGNLHAADGGAVALLGGSVSNQGTIQANLGTVALGAGKDITLDFAGDGLLNLTVNQATAQSLVENHTLVQANGGQVLMSAGAADAVLAGVVNNTGVIQAQTLENREGHILLTGGTVNVAGSLDASAPNGGNGGTIETSGAQVQVANGTTVTTLAPQGQTGQWLIDPTDFTIAPNGGDETGTQVSNNLATTNVTIASSSGATSGTGNINVNDPISWSAGTTLTLNALNNINVNSAITASGANAGVILNYGNYAVTSSATTGTGYFINAPITLSGSNPLFQSNGTTYTVIQTLNALQAMGSNLSGDYVLGENIDATATSSWNSGAGFVPVGSLPLSPFAGIFDGLGHTIINLTINQPTQSVLGLFGLAGSRAVIRDVGLVGGSVTGGSGSEFVGDLVGDNNGSISNAYATGSVTSGSGSEFVGGLVGNNNGGSITNAYASGSVSGVLDVGGLAGNNGSLASISNAYATGSVSGTTNVGGLVGHNGGGAITNSYWDTQTSGQSSSAGGTPEMTAAMEQASTFAAWSLDTEGGVADTWRIYQGNTMPLLKVFLTPLTLLPRAGSTTTYDGISQSVTDSIASVLPTGTNAALVLGTGPMASGINAGSYSLSDSNMYSTQQGYDLIAPLSQGALVINPEPLTVTAASGSKTYDGTSNSTLVPTLTSGTLYNGDGFSGLSESYNSPNVAQANTLSVNNGYTLSDASNYMVSKVSAAGTITPAVISLSGTETYNATTTVQAGVFDPSGSIAGVDGETVKLTGTGTVASKNVGNNLAVNATGLSLGNDTGLASNYTLVGGTDTVTITPEPLTVTAASGSKTYDGTSNSTLIPTLTSGTLYNGDGFSGLSESYNSPNVAQANTLSVNNGYTLSDASNYMVSKVSAAGTIVPEPLTVTAASGSKTYDGTSNSTLIPTLTSGTLYNGDGFSGLSESYNSPNVLQVNTLSVNNGYTLSDASNYMVSTVSAAGTITPAVISLSGSEVYNGTTSVAASAFGTPLPGVDGQTLGLTGMGTASSANVGTNLSVNPSGLSLGNGTGLASNYTLVGGADTVTITPATLTLTALTNTKAYDGTTSALATPMESGLVTGDSLTNLSESYASPNVMGTNGSTLNVNPTYTLSDPNNYTVHLVSAMGTITAAQLTLAITAATNTKVYDGTTSALAKPTESGLVTGDTLTNLSESYVSPNVMGTNGSTLIVNPNYILSDPSNYKVTLVSAKGTITPAPLTITAISGSTPFAPLNLFGFHGGFGVTYSGFVDGQNASVLGGKLTYGGNSQGAYLPLFTYAITPGGLTSSNYAIAWVPGRLTITLIPLTLNPLPIQIPPVVVR